MALDLIRRKIAFTSVKPERLCKTQQGCAVQTKSLSISTLSSAGSSKLSPNVQQIEVQQRTDFHAGGVAVVSSQKFLLPNLAGKTLMEVLQRVQSHAKQLDLMRKQRRQQKQSVAESMRASCQIAKQEQFATIYNCPFIQSSIGTRISL